MPLACKAIRPTWGCLVPKHERYQELCALAMAGEASGAEQRDLKAHLDICPECREEYREFVQLVLPQLSLSMDAVPKEEPSPSEQNAIRSRFLAHAQSAGINFSESTFSARPSCEHAIPIPITKFVHRRTPIWYGVAFAACLLICVGGGAYFELLHRNATARVTHSEAAIQSQPERENKAIPLPPPAMNDSSHDAANHELQARLNAAIEELRRDRGLLSRTEEEKARLANDLKQQADRLSVVEADKENAKNAAADLRAKLDQQQSRASLNEANYIADEVRIRELTDQLAERNTEVERDRQLMSVKGLNLMATRNLHIVDVSDSDSKGNVKGAFGRIFIVDEKQLIFYAYDLNETRLQDAKYAYRVWGQKEGPGQIAKALGVFSSDDKSQRRWVFTCDDPKTLSQIDSVFVTIGPANTPQPRGDKLMYAYLRGPVNHP